MRWIAALIVLLGAARANTAELADQLNAAYAAFQAGRYAQAIAAFQKAYAIEPEPRFLLNIAVSQSRMQACDKALETFELLFSTCGPDCTLRAAADLEHVATKKGCLAKVRIDSRPTGAQVTVNGQTKAAPADFALDAGTYRLRVERPEHVAVEEELSVAWRADTRLMFALLPSPDRRGELTVRGVPPTAWVELKGEALGEAPVALAPGPYTLAVHLDDDPPRPLPVLVRPGGRTEIDLAAALIEPPADYRDAAWIALGVGAAGLIAGVIFHAQLADSLETERTAIGRANVEAAQDDAVQNAILAQAGYGVALLGLGSAITFWALTDGDRE